MADSNFANNKEFRGIMTRECNSGQSEADPLGFFCLLLDWTSVSNGLLVPTNFTRIQN